MKYPKSLRCRFIHHAVFAGTFLAMTHLSEFSVTASPIVANFEHGNSGTYVDAWQGMAGDGWLGGWTSGNNSNSTLTGTVQTTNPLASGGNRLEVTLTSLTASNRGGAVGRQYDASVVSYSAAQTISFDFRLDSAISTANRFYFFDSSSRHWSGETSGQENSWVIRGDPGATFWLLNREVKVNTNFALNQGDNYRFTVNVSPSSIAEESFYTVRIDNLTNGTFYDSETPMLFFTPSTGTHGFINFAATTLPSAAVVYSIGNVQVIPEGSAVVMGGLGLLMLGALRFSKLTR